MEKRRAETPVIPTQTSCPPFWGREKSLGHPVPIRKSTTSFPTERHEIKPNVSTIFPCLKGTTISYARAMHPAINSKPLTSVNKVLDPTLCLTLKKTSPLLRTYAVNFGVP